MVWLHNWFVYVNKWLGSINCLTVELTCCVNGCTYHHQDTGDGVHTAILTIIKIQMRARMIWAMAKSRTMALMRKQRAAPAKVVHNKVSMKSRKWSAPGLRPAQEKQAVTGSSKVSLFTAAKSVCLQQQSLSVYSSKVCLFTAAKSVCVQQQSLSVTRQTRTGRLNN